MHLRIGCEKQSDGWVKAQCFSTFDRSKYIASQLCNPLRRACFFTPEIIANLLHNVPINSFPVSQPIEFLICCLALPLAAQNKSAESWRLAGADITNSRTARSNVGITAANVSSLTASWIYRTADDVSATPSVDAGQGAVYFPDWAGNLYKLDSGTGAEIWQTQISDYGLPPGSMSRTTPSIVGNNLIVGAGYSLANGGTSPAYLLSLNATNGSLNWATVLDDDASSISTGSPVLYNGIAYVGVSSTGEGIPNSTFRGSLVAVSIASGQILWKTYMTPETPAGQSPPYSGAPVWSSTPAIDVADNLIFTTTGNNYDIPKSVQSCEVIAQDERSNVIACQSAANYADSMVALDLTTGAVVWSFKGTAADNWNSNCAHDTPGCPIPPGNDFDFGSGPNFFTVTINGKQVPIVGAGQKSGRYFALNARTGDVVWKTKVGPGGLLGGIQWGTAYDGEYIYVAISNTGNQTYNLQPSNQPWNGGSWAALDPASGRVVWQVADPGFSTVEPGVPAMDLAPVSEANGVVYAASMSGAMYALDAGTGATLWSFQANGSVNAGPAIVEGSVFWGSGYHHFPAYDPVGTGSNRFYCFSLP